MPSESTSIKPNDEIHGVAQSEVAALRALLISHGVAVEKWGIGAAKSIETLYEEMSLGRTKLHITSGGQILRLVSVAAIDVTYTANDGTVYKLKEEKRIKPTPDGEEIELPPRNLNTSLGETMENGDEADIFKTAQRGLSQELQITSPQTLKLIRSEQIVRERESYPGLPGVYSFHYFIAELSPQEYLPDGYTEVGSDGVRTYFAWDIVATSN